MVVNNPVASGALRRPERGEPAFDLGLDGAVRVEACGRRLGGDSGHKRLVTVQTRPRPLVDEEGVEPSPAEPRSIGLEAAEHCVVARPDLPEIQRVDHLRGPDQVEERVVFTWRQRREIGREIGRH